MLSYFVGMIWRSVPVGGVIYLSNDFNFLKRQPVLEISLAMIQAVT